jgi:hypothetical protein
MRRRIALLTTLFTAELLSPLSNYRSLPAHVLCSVHRDFTDARQFVQTVHDVAGGDETAIQLL